MNLIEHRTARRHIEVAQIRLVIELGRFLVHAVMQIARLDEASQLVGRCEGLRHPNDSRLRVAVVTCGRAYRVGHAAPRLHQPVIQALRAIPGERPPNERPVEGQELLAISCGRVLDIHLMTGAVPRAMLLEQTVWEVRDCGHWLVDLLSVCIYATCYG
jgi:hypothetical protein